MMRLSMETLNLGLDYGIKEALRLMKDAGFDAADLTLDKINPDDDLLHRPDMREFAVSLRKYAEEHGFLFAELSAATNQGVKELMKLTWHELQELPPVFVYEPEFVEETVQDDGARDWKIDKVEDYYVVSGAWVDKVMGSVNVDDYESRQYLDRRLRGAGVFDKLEEMGIKDGDPVVIGEMEFEYER